MQNEEFYFLGNEKSLIDQEPSGKNRNHCLGRVTESEEQQE